MNTSIKRAIKRATIAAGITTVMVLPLAGRASDGTITFTGAVTGSTCSLTVNGAAGGSATVTLPIVDASALGTAGSTAAGTFFSIGVSGCTTKNDIDGNPPTEVSIYFEAGSTVDQATGGLINTATGGSDVEVKLYNASANSVVGTQIEPGTPTGQPTSLTVADGGTQWFYAGYSATGAGTTASAGAVSTTVTYSLVYQ